MARQSLTNHNVRRTTRAASKMQLAVWNCNRPNKPALYWVAMSEQQLRRSFDVRHKQTVAYPLFHVSRIPSPYHIPTFHILVLCYPTPNPPLAASRSGGMGILMFGHHQLIIIPNDRLMITAAALTIVISDGSFTRTVDLSHQMSIYFGLGAD